MIPGQEIKIPSAVRPKRERRSEASRANYQHLLSLGDGDFMIEVSCHVRKGFVTNAMKIRGNAEQAAGLLSRPEEEGAAQEAQASVE